jgi:hypothetical protein
MDPTEALTLAAIAYRGCELNLSNPHSQRILHDEITRGLSSFSRVQGKWELVWGPAGYCSGGAGLDDSAMYVVRNKQSPKTLAIVVRGTNLFSLGDWESNFRLAPQTWAYGSAGSQVKISDSIGLGLSILQILRAQNPPPPPVVETAAEQARAAATKAQAAAGYAFITTMVKGTAALDVSGIFADIASKVTDWFGHSNDATIVQAATVAQPPSPPARTLAQFLTAFVSASAGPVDLHVIGHSKGGALATALAMWLADTQGPSVAEYCLWDPHSTAVLHPHSFAAPTAGNSGFAQRFAGKFPGAYRLANPYDIIPHAWNTAEISEVPDLYGNQLKLLRIPADALALFLQQAGYQHEIGAQPWPAQPLANRTLPAQIAFNHLDAYLTKLAIPDPGLSILRLFAPIAS